MLVGDWVTGGRAPETVILDWLAADAGVESEEAQLFVRTTLRQSEAQDRRET